MYKFMNLWKLNVTHFAPDAGGAGGSGGEGGSEGGEDGSEDGDDSEDENGGGSDKRFTQEEVNKIMSKEKRKGRASLLRELGLNPEDKNAVASLKKLLEDQETDKDKQERALKEAQEKATGETGRADRAERKLKVLLAGCGKDYVEEVTAMAMAKVSDDMDFDEALEEVKKKMPSLFGGSESGDNGTGRGQGHRKQGQGKPGSLGSRLAQNVAAPKDNPYFKN